VDGQGKKEVPPGIKRKGGFFMFDDMRKFPFDLGRRGEAAKD
jgi:hypothetical protein